MKTKTQILLCRLNRLNKTYCSWFHVYYPDMDDAGIKLFFSHMERLVVTRGLPFTIQYIKAVRLSYTKWMADDKSPTGVALHTDGIPKFVRKTIGIYSNHERYIPLCLTLLCVMRTFNGQGIPSINDIEDQPTFDVDFVKSLESSIPDFLAKIGAHNVIKTIENKTHWFFTLRQGPNGPSMKHIYADMSLIPDDIWHHLFIVGGIWYKRAVEVLLKLIKLPDAMQDILEIWGTVAECKKHPARIAKISVLQCPEGKTRTVAVGTYWVQAALYGLHRAVFRILRRIPGDITFDQSRGLTHIRKRPGHSYWSFDLKAATDRFPRKLQYLVLRHLVGEGVAKSWNAIMEQPFWIEVFKRDVKWNTGQPIGFLSSWGVFTLCHHFVIYIAHKNARVSLKRRSYVILGDDVVICDDRVAEQYLILITKLGVDISPMKTHKSSHSFEIGKRWMHKGTEVSPYSMLPLFQARNWVCAIVDSIKTESRRNWSCHSISMAASSYVVHYNGITHNKDIERITRLAVINDSISESSNYGQDWHTTFTALAEQFKVSWNYHKCVADAVAKGVCYNTFYKKTWAHWEENDKMYRTKVQGKNANRYSSTPHFWLISRYEDLFMAEVWATPKSINESYDNAKLVKSLSIPNTACIFSASRETVRVMQNSALLKDICWYLKEYHAEEVYSTSQVLPEWVVQLFYQDLTYEPAMGSFFRSIPSFTRYIQEADGVDTGLVQIIPWDCFPSGE